jgi:hypothetical protein
MQDSQGWSPVRLRNSSTSVSVVRPGIGLLEESVADHHLLDGKLGRDASRERNRAAVLHDLARQFGEKEGVAADA